MAHPVQDRERRPRSEKTLAFRLSAAVVFPIVSAIARLRVYSAQNVPQTGPFILAPNHYSELDPVIVGVAVYKLGRAPHFLAKASLFRLPVVGRALRAMGHVPVERAGRNRSGIALRDARSLAERGHCVIVYPEGTLTRDPDLWPMRGKTGAVRLALESGLPIVPMAHWGVQEILPRYSKRPRLFPRKTVTFIVGAPMTLDEYRGRPMDQKLLTEATDAVMAEISRLLGRLRQETPPAARWNPAEHNQTDTGRF